MIDYTIGYFLQENYRFSQFDAAYGNGEMSRERKKADFLEKFPTSAFHTINEPSYSSITKTARKLLNIL